MAFNHEKFQTVCADVVCASAAGGMLATAGWILYAVLVDPIKEKIQERKEKKLAEAQTNEHSDEHQVDDKVLDFDPLPDQKGP